MVNKLTASIFLAQSINRTGTSKLYLQIIINRKIKRYPLNIYIEPENFDKAKKCVTGANKGMINRILTRELNRSNDIYLNLREKQEEISFLNFENSYFNRDTTSLDKIFDLHAQNISKMSQKPFKTVLKELETLFGKLQVNMIDLNVIQEYHNSIKNKANNTIWSKHKCLKSLINTAIRYGIYKHDNPYKSFKVKFKQTIRTYLTIDELQLIEDLLINKKVPEKVRETSISFLFQCYTGIRYSDLVNLTRANLVDGYIHIQMEKTEEITSIPIIERASKILLMLKPDKEKLFDVPSNQKYNDALKLIAFYTNIDKRITSHVARHTFAIVCIDLGIPIEVIADILGHRELKTTKIYAQIHNPIKTNYMQRWNDSKNS